MDRRTGCALAVALLLAGPSGAQEEIPGIPPDMTREELRQVLQGQTEEDRAKLKALLEWRAAQMSPEKKAAMAEQLEQQRRTAEFFREHQREQEQRQNTIRLLTTIGLTVGVALLVRQRRRLAAQQAADADETGPEARR